MSSVNRDNLTSLSHIFIPFMPFSCITAKTSNTKLNKGGESGCLGPDFKGKAFSLFPFNTMLAVHINTNSSAVLC